jgi:hypothetical protein
MILKVWRARLMGSASDAAMHTRILGRDPHRYVLILPEPPEATDAA